MMNFVVFLWIQGLPSGFMWRGVGFEADNQSIVHHAIVFLDLPAVGTYSGTHAEVEALLNEDPIPGYSCFGGPVAALPMLAGYAPGTRPQLFPKNATFSVPPGTRFVVQMHYNFVGGTGSDRSTVLVWQADTPAAISPRGLMVIEPFFTIPPGVSEHSAVGYSTILPSGDLASPSLFPLEQSAGWIWQASGHMHVLGKSIRVDLERQDGSEECLLDIPKWDFNWQGSYRFVDPVWAEAGDKVRITCSWDNSPENQPVIDNQRTESREVRWGQGTLDEMCLGGVVLTD